MILRLDASKDLKAGSLSKRLFRTSTDPEPGWRCRVALADLHRPRDIVGRDSIEALDQALACARGWLDRLRGEGFLLYRDREGREPYDLDATPS